MQKRVVVLGATGRFGRAAMAAFGASGWTVRAFSRSMPNPRPADAQEWMIGDAHDRDMVVRAAEGCDVIVNALNPPYPLWRQDLPVFTKNVIAAAWRSGATVMLPGNVYNYGAGMPSVLSEETPHLPTTRKGRLREEMEQSYAGSHGIRTIVLRAGDFIDGRKTGNWLENHILAGVEKGKVMYPGPLDRVHAWAYLPDMAAAMARLAGKRHEISDFEEFGFPGFSLTGRELIAAVEKAAGRSLKVRGMPWPLVRIAGRFSPLMREVTEMAYLWKVPHRVDGSKLAATLPDLPATSLDRVIAEVVENLAGNRSPADNQQLKNAGNGAMASDLS
ncbi:NAD-dependent epimerase/dehydratase family protein [Roseibium aggregatum]|uniref:NAD(P)H-binding protein n=1 Tax=Roseibium aggregatum TaxID=187304 RepID=A0A926NVU2_9HYPH|nr:NAD-dependent epimerase/dehydratase family protein [Roseibium aggregatum]MBD1548322.1 NAD(P)H-binding protein [Roseibium aggregatum]